MCDPIIIVAIIGVLGYALQNWLIKKWERDQQLYILKRNLYENLIIKLVEGIYVVHVEKSQNTLEYKKDLTKSLNILYLYGSNKAINAMNDLRIALINALISDEENLEEPFRNLTNILINEIRPRKLEDSDINIFLAR